MAYYSVRTQAVGLVGWLLVSFAAATLGGIASAAAGDFYRHLNRPDWAPPASVFAPVWTLLYALQGISAWLIWRERHASGRRSALVAFVCQLAVNALWSWLFFAWRQGGLAFAEVLFSCSPWLASPQPCSGASTGWPPPCYCRTCSGLGSQRH